MMIVGGQLEGSWEGKGAVWLWLGAEMVGLKVINQWTANATFSSIQHQKAFPQQVSTAILNPHHCEDTYNQSTISFFPPDMDQVVVCGDGDSWLPQQSACIVQRMLPV